MDRLREEVTIETEATNHDGTAAVIRVHGVLQAVDGGVGGPSVLTVPTGPDADLNGEATADRLAEALATADFDGPTVTVTTSGRTSDTLADRPRDHSDRYRRVAVIETADD